MFCHPFFVCLRLPQMWFQIVASLGGRSGFRLVLSPPSRYSCCEESSFGVCGSIKEVDGQAEMMGESAEMSDRFFVKSGFQSMRANVYD
jgi:hypothetical protein